MKFNVFRTFVEQTLLEIALQISRLFGGFSTNIEKLSNRTFLFTNDSLRNSFNNEKSLSLSLTDSHHKHRCDAYKFTSIKLMVDFYREQSRFQ